MPSKYERLDRIGLENTIQTDIKESGCEDVSLHALSTG
jgi:hypothetical protein